MPEDTIDFHPCGDGLVLHQMMQRVIILNFNPFIHHMVNDFFGKITYLHVGLVIAPVAHQGHRTARIHQASNRIERVFAFQAIANEIIIACYVK